MRALFVLLALGLGGAAGYYGWFARSSYSAYSAEQLDTLDSNFAQLGKGTDEQDFSRELLATERKRRMLFPALAGAAVLAAIGAYISRGARESFAPTNAESARFAAAMGNPQVVMDGARHKAAALLGVTINAPREVIEAACAAQLASRDATKMDGLAPDLREVARTQREELIRARDLLLRTGA